MKLRKPTRRRAMKRPNKVARQQPKPGRHQFGKLEIPRGARVLDTATTGIEVTP